MSVLHDSAAGYALDALDASERSAFEAHLATCAVCRGEVAELGETVAELTLLSQATPPAGLRAEVLDLIRATPQNAPGPNGPPVLTNGSRPAGPSLRAVPGPGPRRAVPGSEIEDQRDPPVDELALRRSRRRTRVLSGVVAALAAVALGLGALIHTLVQERRAEVAESVLEQQLYAAPDAITTTTRLPGGGQATFIASKQLDRALFLGTDLPDPGPARYQLWTGTGDLATGAITPVRDVQVADPGPGVKLFFRGDVAGADFLAVNLEPAGSAPAAPTTDVLAAARV